MGRVLNQEPRPRVVAVGLTSEQIKSISHLCPTLRCYDLHTASLPMDECDLLISAHGSRSTVSTLVVGNAAKHREKSIFLAQNNSELSIPDLVSEGPYQEAVEHLAKAIREGNRIPPKMRECPHPLLTVTNGIVTGFIQQPVDLPDSMPGPTVGNAILAIPHIASLPLFLKAFLIDLNIWFPEAVPHPPAKQSHPQDWYTPTEQSIANEIQEHKQTANQLMKEITIKEIELLSASEQADGNERQLLFVNGDALEDAVEEALKELGLEVEGIDRSIAAGQPRREDLQVRCDSIEGAILVEVKGYRKGARTNDLQQLHKHQLAYTATNSEEPSATWWIVNEWRNQDPTSRAKTDENVGSSAAMMGVVVFTTLSLFRLRSLVWNGTLTADAARQKLLTAKPGLWRPE